MKEAVLTSPRSRTRARRPGLIERGVRSRLEQLATGRLTVTAHGEETTYGPGGGPRAVVRVHDDGFWSAIALRGSVGAGESYFEGAWSADDLTEVVRLFVLNRDALLGVDGGLARLSAPLRKAYHALRRNSRAGSKRNITAHYDLSNDFFELLLDPTMTYSCGIFEREDASLEEASVAKIDRLCRKLELRPGDRLMEIGTGWGAFAIHAAREYGARVTTTTISEAQHAFAARRIEEAGLSDKIELLLRDYRDLEGTYDKLVSVEMIEAVGCRYFDSFFSTCSRLLAPDGRMALQAITIADQHYERALRSVDFIQRHVFPGSCIPSVTALSGSIARSSELKLVHLEDITPHYARTLKAWRENLWANADRIRALGMDDAFLRLWEYYLCYCEGGFLERHIGDVQMVLDMPHRRSAPILPALVA